MNTYKIRLKGYETETLVCAETAGKAKYQHYIGLDDLFGSFEMFLYFVESCRYLRKAKKEDYYRKNDDFERTKRYRGVPLADYGTEVELRGKRGFIIGCNDSCNFDVKFDDGIFNCHPNYELIYYGSDRRIIYDFRKSSKGD